MISAALAKVPALDPRTLDDIYVGCAGDRVTSRAAMWRARIADPARIGSRSRPQRSIAVLRLQRARPPGSPSTRSGPGEGDAFVSAGVECLEVSRFSARPVVDPVDTHNPIFARRGGAQPRLPPRATSKWHDPREDGLLPDIYIAMGQTAENLATLRGISRAEQDEFGVRSRKPRRKGQLRTRSSTPRSHRSTLLTAPW